MGTVPKIVSLYPPAEAAAGLVPNRATIEDIEAALLRAPNLLARLGLHSEDGRTLDLHQIGLGHYAHAFLLPSGLVLKVTDDEDDARVCKMIMDLANGKPGLPFIEAVYRLPGDVYENETDAPFERPLFAIVMEPVTPASKYGLSRTRWGEVRNRLLGEAVLYPSEEASLATDEARAFVKVIRRGIHWLAQHGVSVVDLHHGNFGYASGKRPVLIDFGHGSLQDEFIMEPIAMASNPQKPTDRDVREVWRALGSPDVDLDELRMGIEVEQEHGGDMRQAGKVAMDHLREFPDYYTRLTKMEARAKAGLEPNSRPLPWSAVSREMNRHDPHRGTSRSWQAPADADDLTWTRERVNIRDILETDPWSKRDVAHYSKLSPATQPPVLLVEEGRGLVVWDGAHRVAAARQRGDSYVDAFVGRGNDDELTRNTGLPMPKVRAAFDECFDALVEQFPDFGDLELHQDEKAGSDNGHGSERQFGYCMDGKPIRVAFAAKTEKLPVANIRGLMAHEFGHALDYRYGDKLGKMLGQRLPEGVERRADAIAKAVFGRTIKYDSRDIQCVACQGKSVRPRRLG